jgi:hypothetical protein
MGNTASATLLTNSAPAISSNTLAPQAGSSAASFTIATAVDPDQPVNALGVTINGNPTMASSNGVTVSGVTIAPSGAVTANISTTCPATSATFTLVVTDNENATGTGTLTINVQPNRPPTVTYTTPQTAPSGGALTISSGGGECPTITLADLPNGAPSQFYNGSVTASPAGSYSYAVTSGSLPPGLTLYGSFGLIYGYPTTAGAYNFTNTATDTNNCTGSKNYSLNIGGSAVASLMFGDFDGTARLICPSGAVRQATG